MKLFIKLITLVMILALVGPFIIKGPDGQPLASISKVKSSMRMVIGDTQQSLNDVSTSMSQAIGDEAAGKTEVYRWQDSNGQWHYSDEKPNDLETQTVLIDPNVVEMKQPSASTNHRSRPSQQHGQLNLPAGILTPGRAKEAIDQTRSVKEQMEQRQEQINQRIEDL